MRERERGCIVTVRTLEIEVLYPPGCEMDKHEHISHRSRRSVSCIDSHSLHLLEIQTSRQHDASAYRLTLTHDFSSEFRLGNPHRSLFSSDHVDEFLPTLATQRSIDEHAAESRLEGMR